MFKNDRRIGKFYISCEFIEYNPEVVRKIMSKMIVVRAEVLWNRAAVEYHAICDLFDHVGIGCDAPEYKIVFQDSDFLEVKKA